MIDDGLNSLWQKFLTWQWANHPMLEAYVAAFAFAFYIGIFRLLDQCSFMTRYRFNKTTTLPSLTLANYFSLANGILPAIIYLLTIHIYHYFIMKLPLTQDSPTILRLGIEVLFGIIAYDFIFFWIHLGMHYFPQYQWFHQHFIHHQQQQGSGLLASEVQHHSLIDASLQILTNIFIQNIRLPYYGRKHSLSRLFHNLIITYMLTEIHAGYDGWWSLHNVFPSWIVGGAKRHEIHHIKGDRYFQQFFNYLDDFIIKVKIRQ